jgi:NitT/TauT family transport system ATP-binding protein
VWIDAPYPRDKTFRTSSVYNEYCRITSGELSRVADGVNEE